MVGINALMRFIFHFPFSRSSFVIDFSCHNWAMRKGVIEAVYAAGFILACFIVVNAFQIWHVHYDYSDTAGFPLVCYSRGGIIGIASLDEKAVLLNYFIATAVAGHVALSVFALSNAKAIIRRIRQNGKLEG